MIEAKYCPNCKDRFAKELRFCPNDGFHLSLPDPYSLVGRTLNGYRIDALVGIGGMGAVYAANQLGTGRRVAFKVLLPNLALLNPRSTELFENEARIAARLDHKNIVSIYDAGKTPEGIAFIAMEWLQGVTLDEELAAQRVMEFARISFLLEQICAALSAAHDEYIIHRDLKPSNIMVLRNSADQELVKVLDFGIAKAADNTEGAMVTSLVGTPHYASPEQFQPGGSINSRSDIYSLGVVLFQLITGEFPFHADSIRELIQLHLYAVPPPVQAARPDAPLALQALLSSMLAKDPASRPGNAQLIPGMFNDAILSSSKNREQEIFTVKICMLGAPGVGKTSLVARFVSSLFSESYLTTVGVKVDRKDLVVDDHILRCNIWDLAGEDEFQPVKMEYLKGALGYLLVIDGTRSSTVDIALTLKDKINETMKSLPCTVIINKSDLKDKWELPPRMTEGLTAQGIQVVTTSAKTGAGVEEAFNSLARQIILANI